VRHASLRRFMTKQFRDWSPVPARFAQRNGPADRPNLLGSSGYELLPLARFGAWKKAATPFPSVDVDRTAGAPPDRADADVAVIDVPAVAAFFCNGGG
jgi:hypothetical protein